MIRAASPASLLLLMAGFVAWGSAFLALYGLLSLGCAFGWSAIQLGPTSLQRLVLGVVWAAHLVGLGVMVIWLRRHAAAWAAEGELGRFMGASALAATWAALAATVLSFAPIFGVSACL